MDDEPIVREIKPPRCQVMGCINDARYEVAYMHVSTELCEIHTVVIKRGIRESQERLRAYLREQAGW